MQILNCCIRKDCTAWAVIISIIAGILAAFLQITAVITLAVPTLIVAFGIAVMYLAVLLLASAIVRRGGAGECLCSPLSAVLLGALGTVATAVVLLLIPFAATSIVGAIVVGLLTASFTLLLTASACLIRCLFGCNN